MTSGRGESLIRVGSRKFGRSWKHIDNIFEEFFCKEEQRVGVVVDGGNGVNKGFLIG